MSKLKPLADIIVAEKEQKKTQTESGILLPKEDKSQIARVLAVGKDVKEVKVGSKIIYKPYGITEIKIEDDTFILVKEEETLATIEEDK